MSNNIILLNSKKIPKIHRWWDDGTFTTSSVDDYHFHDYSWKPKEISFLSKVATGVYHNIFLDEKGNVWFTGSGKSMGMKTSRCRLDLTQIQTVTYDITIVDINIENDATIMVDDQGRVLVCGDMSNFSNYLGRRWKPCVVNQCPPEIVLALFSGNDGILLLDKQGTVWYMKTTPTTMLVVENATVAKDLPFTKIIANGYDNDKLLISINGEVWAYGDNVNGKLGLRSEKFVINPTCLGIPSFIVDGCFYGNLAAFLIDREGNIWFAGLDKRTDTRTFEFQLFPCNFKAVEIFHTGYTNNDNVVAVDDELNYWVLNRTSFSDFIKINASKAPMTRIARFKRQKSAMMPPAPTQTV